MIAGRALTKWAVNRAPCGSGRRSRHPDTLGRSLSVLEAQGEDGLAARL
jgi:hypothetical protein